MAEETRMRAFNCTSGLERGRLHALADTLYAEARMQGAVLRPGAIGRARPTPGFDEIGY